MQLLMEAGVVDEKQSVGGMDAAIKPTGTYSRRLCVRPDSCSPSHQAFGGFTPHQLTPRQRHHSKLWLPLAQTRELAPQPMQSSASLTAITMTTSS